MTSATEIDETAKWAIGIVSAAAGAFLTYLKVRKAASTNDKDIAGDKAIKSIYEQLVAENARLSVQLGEVSATLNIVLHEKVELTQRVAEVESRLRNFTTLQEEHTRMELVLAERNARVEGLLTEQLKMRQLVNELTEQNTDLRAVIANNALRRT